MAILLLVIVIVWIVLSFLFAYLAKELGLTFWIFLVLGLLGSPIAALFALAIYNGFQVALENRE
jgi:hypothetical protein